MDTEADNDPGSPPTTIPLGDRSSNCCWDVDGDDVDCRSVVVVVDVASCSCVRFCGVGDTLAPRDGAAASAASRVMVAV